MTTILTRSLDARPDVVAIVYDAARWRLVYLRDIGDAFWCVPGSRALGWRVVVGRV